MASLGFSTSLGLNELKFVMYVYYDIKKLIELYICGPSVSFMQNILQNGKIDFLEFCYRKCRYIFVNFTLKEYIGDTKDILYVVNMPVKRDRLHNFFSLKSNIWAQLQFL